MFAIHKYLLGFYLLKRLCPTTLFPKEGIVYLLILFYVHHNIYHHLKLHISIWFCAHNLCPSVKCTYDRRYCILIATGSLVKNA